MVSEADKQALQAYLSQLSEGQIEKLVSVTDSARSGQGADASSELIISMLRPSLFRMKPRRLQTPQRILCDPFEDLLVTPNRFGKEITKISRAALAPMWNWVQEIGGASFKDACQAFANAVDKKDENLKWQAACHIWETAASVMRPKIERAYKDDIYYAELGERFGDIKFVDDIKEMLDLIGIGAIVEKLKKDLPDKPIITMSIGDVGIIKAQYIEADRICPGSGAWLVVSIMRRLLHEADILKVLKSFSKGEDDALLSVTSMTDLSMVSDLVIEKIEGYVAMVEKIFEEQGRELDIMDIASDYVASFDAVANNLDIKQEGEWGDRMLATRNNMGNYIASAILEDGERTIRDAFTVTGHRAGETILKTVDLDEDINIDKYRIAERRAKAITKCQKLASGIGLGSKTDAVIKKIVVELGRYEDKLVVTLAQVVKEKKSIAAKHVIMIARLHEVLEGSDGADFFRRRAFGILRRSSVQPSM